MDCIFCKFASGEVVVEKVAESENGIAFKDANPAAPVHILVVPKKHIASLDAADEEDQAILGELMLLVRQVAKKVGIAETGYKVAINVGEGGGQVVFHLHIHIVGGWQGKPKSIIEALE